MVGANSPGPVTPAISTQSPGRQGGIGCFRLRVNTKMPAVASWTNSTVHAGSDDRDLRPECDGMARRRFVGRQSLDGCRRRQQPARARGRGGARAERIDVSERCNDNAVARPVVRRFSGRDDDAAKPNVCPDQGLPVGPLDPAHVGVELDAVSGHRQVQPSIHHLRGLHARSQLDAAACQRTIEHARRIDERDGRKRAGDGADDDRIGKMGDANRTFRAARRS